MTPDDWHLKFDEKALNGGQAAGLVDSVNWTSHPVRRVDSRLPLRAYY
jgi:hypothetical protein